jgi:hypothetical protein
MPKDFAFEAVFVYVAVGLAGIVAVARALLGWALRD